jgi:hypothetical protein
LVQGENDEENLKFAEYVAEIIRSSSKEIVYEVSAFSNGAVNVKIRQDSIDKIIDTIRIIYIVYSKIHLFYLLIRYLELIYQFGLLADL